MNTQGRVYQIFYSKDIRKKKKVYSEGILLCEHKKTKIFTTEGECVVSLNSRSSPVPDEQYTINNTYVVVVDKEVPYDSFSSGKIFIQAKVEPLKIVTKPQKKKESLHKLELDIAKQFQNGLKIQSFIFSKLREHQIQGVQFMYECLTGQKGNNIQGCILADFMGLGKTLQTLTLIRCLLIKKIVSKVMVICPLTLIKVWQKQALKWMGTKLSPLIAFGSSQEITKIIRMFLDYQYRFLVVSYQQFYKFCDSLGSKCDLMIFDEGHRLKNKKSKLFKKIQQCKCKKRVLLTGTPIQNNLQQLYTCIALVNPFFFESQSVFRNVFQKPIISGMAQCASKELRNLALNRTAELAQLIKEFSLRRKADVLENYLPKKRQYQVFLKLSPLQASLYDRILKKKIKDTEVLSYLNQMRKLFTHPILFKTDRFENFQWKDCFQDCREEKSCKMEFVRQIANFCKEKGEKLIIVSYFTETLDFIELMLNQQEISSAKLDGRLQGKERFISIQRFIKSKTVLLLSGKAGGTGLTLTCASKMIMVDPDWNPSNDSQVMGRIWRQGQEKEVQIFRLLIGCSFEQKILQRQQLKQSLSQKLIDEQNNSKSYDFFSMKQLFMQIAPRCLTYSASDNKLQICKKEMDYIDWSESIFVNIIESHQSGRDKLQNEFEEARFEEIEEEDKDQQKEKLDQDDEDLEFIELREESLNSSNCEKKVRLKAIIEKQEEKEENSEETEQQEKQKQIIFQNNQNQGEKSIFYENAEKEKGKVGEQITDEHISTDLTEDKGLPLALRKFKKKLIKIQKQ